MPSLKKVCEHWLRLRMSKEEQCSDWNLRPLSATQIQYAALDAEVLLRLLPAMR
jgi:ribonuclease D